MVDIFNSEQVVDFVIDQNQCLLNLSVKNLIDLNTEWINPEIGFGTFPGGGRGAVQQKISI